jgi:hypothetical protein
VATKRFTVSPSASRLATSLRDIGYDFSTAVADIVDNSIAAGASRIEIRFDHDRPRLLIRDDGAGMTANGLNEALRFGSRREYADGELGRFGLGLKTASLSQCRSLTVVTRDGRMVPPSCRQLSLDIIDEWDEWLIVDPRPTDVIEEAKDMLTAHSGTVVIWEDLDRAFPGRHASGAWALHRAESLRSKTTSHLSLVFQRFLDGSAGRRVTIIVNGEALLPWDPFATHEQGTSELRSHTFDVNEDEHSGTVTLRRWVLPAKNEFSSPAEFDRLAGPLKWNRQQGIYIYRSNRLVQWGGWAGIRAVDEHTKLARCSLDFTTALDPIFSINVAKMRVSVPPSLKRRLEKPLHEICQVANERYRRAAMVESRSSGRHLEPAAVTDESAALALLSASVQTGHYQPLVEMASLLMKQSPAVARRLGLDRL